MSYRCLYCLKGDGGFRSVEHTIPRGLGNEEYILKKGIVCDRCNNGVLSRLDETLLDFDPIKFNRSYTNQQSRKGKSTIYKNAAFNMQHTSESHIEINAEHAGKTIKTRPDGFTMQIKSDKRLTSDYLKLIARALYKIGLGIVYIDLGEQAAYSNRFDEVRQIILGEIDFNGYLAVAKKPAIEQIGTVQHYDRTINGKPISLFRFYYHGVDIMYDMERRTVQLPLNISNEHINLLQF